MTPDRYARVKELFARVVDLDESRRARVLDVECASDPEVREAVESLIQHDDPRTLIQSHDKTVRDFFPAELAVTKSRRFSLRWQKIIQYRRLFGPKGLLAIGGLLCCLLLTLLGLVAQRSIRNFQTELRRESLDEIVDGKVLSLRLWLDHEKDKAESWGRSEKLQELIIQLVDLSETNDDLPIGFGEHPIQRKIQSEVAALAGAAEHVTIWDRRHRLIADSISASDRIGKPATPWGSSLLASVFEGNSEVFSFDKSRSISKFDPAANVTPHLAIVTPIRNELGHIIAALQVHDTNSNEIATQIMRPIRLGSSGETYVFNHEGRMVNSSRYIQQLEMAGLIEELSNPEAGREVYLRDPGGNLTEGFKTDVPYQSLPLTKMARFCISGNDGSDLDGYRDFRGVAVVGAWRWLDDLHIGIATELDATEPEPSIKALQLLAVAVVLLFGFCLCVAIASFYSINRLRANLGENSRLGPYQLHKRIGEGGMGTVFRATHQLLKRNTAIKVLNPELLDPDSIARFNREAQLVSQLEHPNTIRVFDYGVSAQRLFYLVMEYIDGMTLSDLVQFEGPVSPGRAIHLMRQILYSLREAHQTGLVHRDLKPANVMISRRGGVADVIKVLDFGLVKPIDNRVSAQITATNMVAGTPQYLAPERLHAPETNDPRSDLFSFGAVAFYLLTGRSAIEGPSLPEILNQVVNQAPSPPSEHTDQPIPSKLDQLVLRCLAKDPDQRPQTAQEIIDDLDKIAEPLPWTQADAVKWWEQHHDVQNHH